MRSNFFIQHYYLTLSALWLLAILLVNPIGNFPLNDDWAYAAVVRDSLEAGHLVFNNWMAMTLVGQVIWGSIFAGLFGFSYTVLRISTLVLGLAGILVFAKSIKEETGHSQMALLGGLVLAFNPWYFSLSYTFMTDVPFFSILLFSYYFFLKALRTDQIKPILSGTLFAIIATLIRQFGLLLPLCFGLVYMLKHKNWRGIILSALPFVAAFLSMKFYLLWLESALDLPQGFGHTSLIWERLKATNLVQAFYQRTGIILAYVGGFLLPFLCIFLLRGSPPRVKWGIGAVAMVAVILLAIPAWKEIPIGNIIYDFGIGPKVLRDTYFKLNLYPTLPYPGWAILKIMGFLGGVFLLDRFLRTLTAISRLSSGQWMSLLAIFIYSGYLLIDYYFWDRYLLLLIPFVLIFIFGERQAVSTGGIKYIGIGSLLLLLLFSITATHDYLAWNRARWKAINYAQEDLNIRPEQMDAGFEFNSQHGNRERNAITPNGKGWWFVQDDKYVVASGPLDCYDVERVFPYTRFLLPGRDSIYLLERYPLVTSDTVIYYDLKRDHPSFNIDSPQLDTLHPRSGQHSIQLAPEHPYGLTLTFQKVNPCDRFAVRVWRYARPKEGGIVFSAPNPENFYEYQTFLRKQEPSGWDLLEHEIRLPENYPDSIFQIYLWNPGQRAIWFDDLWVRRQAAEGQ